MESKKVFGKRTILMLVMALVVVMMPITAFGSEPSDIGNHWAKDVIDQWVGEGLASGYPDGTFKPENTITRAEFMALVNNAFGYTAEANISFTDVTPQDWYNAVIAKGVEAGYVSGYPDGSIKPQANISRQEVAAIIAKIEDLDGDLSAVSEFTDHAMMPEWSKKAIAAVVEAGYMKGYPDGSFKPVNSIKRGEALAALNKVISEEVEKPAVDEIIFEEAGTYGPEDGTEVIEKDVIIKADGVVLQNYVIEGDLTIAEEVGKGTVTLNNITVEGETFVRGGGTDSIVINGGKFNKITVQKTSSGAIRILAKDIDGLDVVVSEDAAGENIVLEGSFNEVVIEAEDAVIETKGETTIKDMKISPEAKGAVLKVEKGATVEKMEIEAAVKVEGEGTIKEAEVKSDGVSFTKEPEKQTVDEGVEEPKVEKPSTGGGGGGGGGSSTPDLTVKDINMMVDNQYMGTDLSDLEDSARVSAITFTVNTDESEMEMTGLYSPKKGDVTYSNTISFTSGSAKVTVDELLGLGKDSVSLGTLRGFFGESVTVKGKLTADGYDSYTKSITITLGKGSTDDKYKENTWATMVQDGNDIEAYIKDGKEKDTLSSIGVATFIEDTFNLLPSEVKIDSGSWITASTSNYDKIKNELADAANTTWAEMTVGDLAGMEIQFKTPGSDTVFTLAISNE